jgi:hypothetical protein
VTTDPTPDEAADLELLDELRAAAQRFDPVPDAVIEAARAAWTWRTIDAELAELTYDSWTEDKELAGVRGVAATASRMLSFEASGVALELEIDVEGDQRRVLGQIVPAQPGVVEIHHRRGTALVEADAVGRFSAASIAPGLFRLTVRPSGQPREVATAWIQV